MYPSSNTFHFPHISFYLPSFKYSSVWEPMMQRWLSCLPASLPFGLQAGSDSFHSGHLSSLGPSQCHHSAGPSHRYSPERRAQLGIVQMQCHSLYREHSEPLRNVATATLNVNQSITHHSFLRASFTDILNGKSQHIIKSKQTETRYHLSKALELLASNDAVKSTKEQARD